MQRFWALPKSNNVIRGILILVRTGIQVLVIISNIKYNNLLDFSLYFSLIFCVYFNIFTNYYNYYNTINSPPSFILSPSLMEISPYNIILS